VMHDRLPRAHYPSCNAPQSEFYTLFLHDALTILITGMKGMDTTAGFKCYRREVLDTIEFEKIKLGGYGFQIEMKFTTWKYGYKIDRKSTRLNSSHVKISYAVFCSKKKTDYSRTRL